MRFFAAVATALVFLFSAPTIAQTTAVKAAAAINPSVVYISDLNDSHHGSGITIAPFTILTAAHVVSAKSPDGIHDSKDIIVSDASDQKWYATVAWLDDKADLAMLSLRPNEGFSGPPPLPINCNTIGIFPQGQDVLMFGNPGLLKFVMQRGMLASDGVVKKYKDWKSGYILNSLVTPGISGGPSYTLDGDFVGIVVGTFTLSQGRTQMATDYGFVVDKQQVCRTFSEQNQTALVYPKAAAADPATPALTPIPGQELHGIIVIPSSSSE